MRKRTLLCTILVSLAAGPSVVLGVGSFQGTEMAASVEVAGKLLPLKGSTRYELRVSYAAESRKALGEALLVYAEPSHTLLFAHVNTGWPLGKALENESLAEEALALVNGPGENFQHALTLPYRPQALDDSRIDVVMRTRGRDVLLASGKVNVRDFQYSTTFSALATPGGIEYLAGTHCCSGPNCARMCVSCPGAFFSCDLITCTINCEYF